jgi:hypothetical protein
LTGKCFLLTGKYFRWLESVFRWLTFLMANKHKKVWKVISRKVNSGKQTWPDITLFYLRKPYFLKSVFYRFRWTSKISIVPDFYKRCISWLELETCCADLKPFNITLRPLKTNISRQRLARRWRLRKELELLIYMDFILFYLKFILALFRNAMQIIFDGFFFKFF